MSSFAQSLIPLTGPASGVKRNKILPAGSLAPQFTLFVTPNQALSLREFLGRPVILAFYPADWSPVCGDQMALYNEVLPEFAKHRAALVGISVDSVVSWRFRRVPESPFSISVRF
jgi:peroxiredoxin